MKKTENLTRYIFTSVTRISNLEKGFDVKDLPYNQWATGDYVVCKIERISGKINTAEIRSGRMMSLLEGDIIIGALGIRHATLEATGTWKEVGADKNMHMLTSAGLLGKLTSRSSYISPLIEISYMGHVFQSGNKKTMADYVKKFKSKKFTTPVILFVGSSMSAGKTTSARIVAHQLKMMNYTVTGAKLSGAGRYRDVLSIKDAGADFIFDFVDTGLPSTICERDEYKKALDNMLNMISSTDSDVAVIEIGASPMEPYNGDIAIEAIKDNVVLTVLCASDPYAVLGIMKSFNITPTIVTGPAANTIGGIELIDKLCKVHAFNLIDRKNIPKLRALLKERIQNNN
ncbi:MAG: hypothetical protein HKN68_12685 [Saprospiraceae bacterium]|nr:hypothetical protein [Saprospiraceae bacterium]